MAAICAHANKAGRKDVPFELTAFPFTVLDDDCEAARDRAASLLQMIYNRPFRDAAQKYCLLGRPEELLGADAGFCPRGRTSLRLFDAERSERIHL